jgi:hypothetical protein
MNIDRSRLEADARSSLGHVEGVGDADYAGLDRHGPAV